MVFLIVDNKISVSHLRLYLPRTYMHVRINATNGRYFHCTCQLNFNSVSGLMNIYLDDLHRVFNIIELKIIYGFNVDG